MVENQKVVDFIGDLALISSEKPELINAIRQLFDNANSSLQEDIKYGGVVFLHANKLIAGVYPYKDHVSLEFSNGIALTDTASILEGKGKKRRHIKITEMQDIETKNVAAFVTEIVQLARDND